MDTLNCELVLSKILGRKSLTHFICEGYGVGGGRNSFGVQRNHPPKGYTLEKYFEQSCLFSIWIGCFFCFLFLFLRTLFTMV